jgi:hypothetical protein
VLKSPPLKIRGVRRVMEERIRLSLDGRGLGAYLKFIEGGGCDANL